MILWIGRKFIERVVDLEKYLPTSNSRKNRELGFVRLVLPIHGNRELGVVRLVLPIHGFPIHGKFLVPKNVYWEVTLYQSFSAKSKVHDELCVKMYFLSYYLKKN